MKESVQPVLSHPFVLYQSALLSAYAERLRHGFTGKPVSLGGPEYAPETIRENRLQVCRHAGLNSARLTLPRQTHSACFRINDVPDESETDAVILSEAGIPAMVQVADCVPIILYDPEQHLGAVVHAGWRGTAQGITARVVRELMERYASEPENIIAAIGPSIGGCCYEVSMEVAEAVADSIPDYPENLYRLIQENGKPRIDLKVVNTLQLRALGVQQIEVLNACTRCRTDELFSYRRGENGRQVAFLQLL